MLEISFSNSTLSSGVNSKKVSSNSSPTAIPRAMVDVFTSEPFILLKIESINQD